MITDIYKNKCNENERKYRKKKQEKKERKKTNNTNEKKNIHKKEHDIQTQEGCFLTYSNT